MPQEGKQSLLKYGLFGPDLDILLILDLGILVFAVLVISLALI